MTGEAISFATNILTENGALDVYTTAIQMKKIDLLSCLLAYVILSEQIFLEILY